LGEAGIRSRQQANIDALGASTAQSLKFLLLQDSQELGLQFERYIADFIQKQRSFVRQFGSSNLLAMAPVNAPLSWPNNSFSRRPRGGRESRIDG
jgi:hypothetical protein